MQKIKTIFFGTPKIAVPFLKAICHASFLDLVAVITEPNRPSGRGKKINQSPVSEFAQKNKLKLFKPSKIKNLKLIIKNLRPTVTIVVAYGQIIPQSIIDLPKFKTINVHPSNLPRYRGPAPIQAALLYGDNKTAISVMKIDDKMDHGPILDKKIVNIDQDDDYFDLEKKILDIGPKFMIETIKKYLLGKFKPSPQNHQGATYTRLIKKEDGLINWAKSALQIRNQIRAYCAWPKAYTIINNKRLIILKSHLQSGKLILDLVQLEGKKPVLWNEFVKGYKQILPSQLTAKII